GNLAQQNARSEDRSDCRRISATHEPLHVDQRNRTAEAQQSEPEKIQKQLGKRAAFYCRLHCHRVPRRGCGIGPRFEVLSRYVTAAACVSRFCIRHLVQRGTQSMSELDGIIVCPEVHKEQAWLFIKHVTMQSRDLDSVCSKGLDHRV